MFVENQILPAHKTVLIKGSGVDVKTWVPTPNRDGVPVVILAARMLRDKGVVEFVEAAGIAARKPACKARFVLVGDTDPGNPTAISVEQLRNWADTGDVEWWGHRANMQETIAKSHVICLPSLARRRAQGFDRSGCVRPPDRDYRCARDAGKSCVTVKMACSFR